MAKMAKEQAPLTDEEKFELALQTEQELARLARTYTILDRNRQEFQRSGGKLAKYKKVLDIFKKEQHNILTDLAVASADTKKKEDGKLSDKLANILAEYDDFDNEIKIEKAYTKEIEDQIQIVKKKTLELAAMQVSDDKYQERVIRSEKTVQTLENKLEVQIKKFCVICTENKNLREQLQHLLKERYEFNKTWEKLINNLAIGKKFMIDLIEQATIAYDQREEWVTKLQFLRNKARNELITHVQEMRELQRKRDNDIKLQEYFATKGQKRFMKDLESTQLRKREKNRMKLAADLEKYSKLLADIKEFTALNSIRDIIENFLHQEEENFAKFQYVTNLNKQMEELSDNLAKLHLEIDEQKVINEVRKNQQEAALKQLEDQSNAYKNQANEKENEINKVERKLGAILKGIEVLFKLFRCDNDPLVHMLGQNENIHYYNALLYLQILEKSIQEALVNVYHKEKRVSEKKKDSHKLDNFLVYSERKPGIILPIEKICLTNPCPLCIEHDLVSDVIDELQFAYTKDEIQQRLATRLKIEGRSCGLHNVSACHLPKSRQIIQKRYQ